MPLRYEALEHIPIEQSYENDSNLDTQALTKLCKHISRRWNRARRTLANRDKTEFLPKELLLNYFRQNKRTCCNWYHRQRCTAGLVDIASCVGRFSLHALGVDSAISPRASRSWTCNWRNLTYSIASSNIVAVSILLPPGISFSKTLMRSLIFFLLCRAATLWGSTEVTVILEFDFPWSAASFPGLLAGSTGS